MHVSSRETKACQQCGGQFQRPVGISAAHWGDRRYCSKDCSGIARQRQRQKACLNCGEHFYWTSDYSPEAWEKRKHCSRKCVGAAKTKEAAQRRNKRCPKCTQVLPLELFSNSRRRPDGRHHTCKDCVRQKQRAPTSTERELKRKSQQRYYQKNRSLIAERNARKTDVIKSYRRQKVEKLTDAYVAKAMRMRLDEAPVDLIVKKRAALQFYRSLRDFKQAINQRTKDEYRKD